MTNMNHKLKALAVIFALGGASVASAQVEEQAYVEQSATAEADIAPVSASEEAPAQPVKAKKEKKKKCKKGGGGLLGFMKKTGLTSTLVNSAVGGGLAGYATGQVANTAVSEGANAEAKAGSNSDC